MTKSPVSTWLANCGLCLPRSRRAACEARRPRTTSLASMTCQERSTSPGFGEYVDNVQLSRSVFTRTEAHRARAPPRSLTRPQTACTPRHGRDVRLTRTPTSYCTDRRSAHQIRARARPFRTSGRLILRDGTQAGADEAVAGEAAPVGRRPHPRAARAHRLGACRLPDRRARDH